MADRVAARFAAGYVNLAVCFDVDSFAIRPRPIPLLDELGKASGLPVLRDRSVFVSRTLSGGTCR